MDYYREDAPQFVEEFQTKNQVVTELPEAQFLRELRNYVLHCSQLPLITHISFQLDESPTINSLFSDPWSKRIANGKLRCAESLLKIKEVA